MSDEIDERIEPPAARERSVADVAREAFEKRLFEGDGVVAKREAARR